MGGITQSLHITARTYAYDLDDKNGNHPSQQKGKSNRLIKSCIYIYYMLIWYMKNLWCFWEKPTSWIELLNRWHPPNHSLNFGLEASKLSGNGPNAWRLSSICWGKNYGDPLTQVNMMNWILQFSRQISPQWFWRKYQDVWLKWAANESCLV